jgi:hypothetical protein
MHFFFLASAVQGAGGVCPVETDAPSQTTLPAGPCDALVRFGGEALRYYCMRPEATSVCELKLLVYEA